MSTGKLSANSCIIEHMENPFKNISSEMDCEYLMHYISGPFVNVDLDELKSHAIEVIDDPKSSPEMIKAAEHFAKIYKKTVKRMIKTKTPSSERAGLFKYGKMTWFG